MKGNSIEVLNFLKAHDGEMFTAPDIADALGLGVKTVNGIVTAALCRHKDEAGNFEPLAERVPAELELEDGSHRAVKFVVLTEAGKAFDPYAKTEA